MKITSLAHLTIAFACLACVSLACAAGPSEEARQAQAFMEQGYAYEKEYRDSEAMEAYKKAIAADPSSAEAHLLLGRLYGKERRYDDSAKELEAAIQLDAAISPRAVPFLVFIYLFKDDPRAAEHVKRLFAVDPEAAGRLYQHVFYARIFGLEEAPGGFETRKKLAAIPQDAALAGKMRDAEAFISKRMYAEAIEAYKKILSSAGIAVELQAAIHNAIGNIYLYELKDSRQGIPYFEKAVALNPDELALRMGLIDAYRMLEDYQKALEEDKKILAADPLNKYGLYVAGSVYFKLRRFGEAISNWEKLRDVDRILFGLVEEAYISAHEEAREALHRLSEGYSGSQAVLLKSGLTLRPDAVSTDKGNLLLFFKGSKPKEGEEFEDIAVIPLNEIESINGAPPAR